MQDPLLIPQAAFTHNTVHALDRSQQYQDQNADQQRRALNEAWSKIRANAKAIESKDAEILELRNLVKRHNIKRLVLVSIIATLSSILSGLAWQGLKVIVPAILESLIR